MKDRVCGAIVVGDRILMVHHQHDNRDYWTLPGGGAEEGETPEQAIIREVSEETGLDVVVKRFLFQHYIDAGHGPQLETCFLLRAVGDKVASPGRDPELASGEQIITGVAWFPLESLRDDVQVSKVLASLGGERHAGDSSHEGT